MKKLIHDKLMAALLILATAVTVIMVLMEYRYEAGLNADTENKSNHDYAVSYWIYVINLETIGEEDYGLENLETGEMYKNFDIPNVEGNIIFKDYSNLTFDNSFDSTCADIYIRYSETPLEELESGRYPTIKEIENGDKLIVIGRAWLPFVTKNGDEMYIGINGENYKVTGVLEDNILGEEDKRIYMFFNSMSKKGKNNVIETMHFVPCDIVYRSRIETEGTDVILDKWLKDELPETDWAIQEVQKEEDNQVAGITEMILEINKYMAMLIYAFGVVSCFFVARIWSKRRTKELMIRMALGESKSRLGRSFCLNLVVIQMIGTITAFVIISITVALENISFRFWTINMKGLLIQVILIFVITVIMPLVQLRSLSPAQGLQKW